jgi:hypothetical protein
MRAERHSPAVLLGDTRELVQYNYSMDVYGAVM